MSRLLFGVAQCLIFMVVTLSTESYGVCVFMQNLDSSNNNYGYGYIEKIILKEKLSSDKN